jgi:hypothetical protein
MDKVNNKFMEMSPWEFDQSPQGWRKFEAGKEYIKAANLIGDYINFNTEKILHPSASEKTVSIRTLHFHTGQLLAFAGADHYPEAIVAFGKSFRDGAECWNAYVSATIGFLSNNIQQIEDAIRAIENSKEEDKRSGNIGIIHNFKKALEEKVLDYGKVYAWPRS